MNEGFQFLVVTLCVLGCGILAAINPSPAQIGVLFVCWLLWLSSLVANLRGDR